jgi:hypothetical protein
MAISLLALLGGAVLVLVIVVVVLLSTRGKGPEER